MLSGLPTVHVLGALKGSPTASRWASMPPEWAVSALDARSPDTQSILDQDPRPHGKHEHHVGRPPENRLDHRSTKVGSPMRSCQVLTGSWLAISVEEQPCRSSTISMRSGGVYQWLCRLR